MTAQFKPYYLILLLLIGCKSHTIDTRDKLENKRQKRIEVLLKSSQPISNQTFDLKFLLRVLPDNGWFLELRKDSTYEYNHWNGLGRPEGTILENGKYSIENNKIKLHPEGSKNELGSSIFYLIISANDEIQNPFSINCVEPDSVTYCLVR